jgi:hypothetical protein
LARIFHSGPDNPPPKDLEKKRLRTQLGVTQYPGRIFGPDISFRAGYSGWSDYPAILWLDNPPLRVSNGYIWGGAINTRPLLPPQAARPKQEEHHIWGHKNHKISSLNPPKLLIFGESKEKALIYILTEAIYFPLSFA